MAGCPVVDLSSNTCELNGQPVACNIIRECDALTGAQHFEYALPGGNTNPNIWVMQANGSFTFNGPDKPVVPAPTPTAAALQPVYADPIIQAYSSTPAPTPTVISPNFGQTPGHTSSMSTTGPAGMVMIDEPKKDGQSSGWLDDLSPEALGQKLTKPVGNTGIPLWVLLAAAAIAGRMFFGDKR